MIILKSGFKLPVCQLLSLLLATLLFSSCSEQPVYEELKSIENTWSYSDSLNFSLPVPDTTNAYDLFIDIVHSTDYDFQNLYLKIGTTFPSGRYASDIFNIDLADKAGQWYGDCGSQGCRITGPYRAYFAFNEVGTYAISVSQHTRTDNLDNINSVALELWPAVSPPVED